MHLGKQLDDSAPYCLGQSVMAVTEGEKDSGVLVDRELKFHQHTTKTVKKANQILGLIKRTFLARSKRLILPLYRTMVRPILEYGNAVWGPTCETDKINIEKTQRRATRLITEVNGLPYEEQLTLSIPSLCHRRYKGDMIQMFKIMHKIERLNPEHFFKQIANDRTRGHSIKVSMPRVRLLTRQRFFSSRTVSGWNRLLQSLIDSENANQFKNSFDKMQTCSSL